MDRPSEFVVEDVRCFGGAHGGRLRPITLLIGENSTGKTTFLGCYGVLHRLFSGWSPAGEGPDFNREPFAMGSFHDIVRARRGRGGRIDEFGLSLRVEPTAGGGPPSHWLHVTFSEEGSQPVVSAVRYDFEGGLFVELRRGGGGRTIMVAPQAEKAVEYPFDGWWLLLNNLSSGKIPPFIEASSGELQQTVDHISTLSARWGKGKRTSPFAPWLPDLPRLVPVAPLRSKPKRTYDPVRESASPDGEHIPMLMMRLDRTDKGGWNELHDDLAAFGRTSGLFSDIRVKRHGRHMSDPFQLRVKVRSGLQANIMDVGYGISQSLPILVDTCVEQECVFLLQQPEVHLHPRAQAELAGLFVESFRKRGNRFLIETHSDHIVDRVRILVRQRTLSANDVSILYFEPQGNAAAIHSLTLDDEGNLESPPRGYRDFFIKETDRLLGFAG